MMRWMSTEVSNIAHGVMALTMLDEAARQTTTAVAPLTSMGGDNAAARGEGERGEKVKRKRRRGGSSKAGEETRKRRAAAAAA
jgi:hypothetical protein